MTNIIYTKTKIRVFPDMGELDSNLSSMENKQMMKEFLLREENITISQFLHEIFPLKELFQNISSFSKAFTHPTPQERITPYLCFRRVNLKVW